MAPACLQQLSAQLLVVCKNPTQPGFNHYLFESVAALIRWGGAGRQAGRVYVWGSVRECGRGPDPGGAVAFWVLCCGMTGCLHVLLLWAGATAARTRRPYQMPVCG